ncbi:26S proteasome regulatory subunit [Myotisia sp. PD_48]|nr:26S proteasome regulatory subunit [Myotisia sp. PD_48]
MQADEILEFLTEIRAEAPGRVQTLVLAFEDFWERKLWHQLTNALEEYFILGESTSQKLPIFVNFVVTFADKINQLRFVTLGLMASTECDDDQERLTFLSALSQRVNKPTSQDAYVYAATDVASVRLRLQDFEGARKTLEHLQSILDSFDSVENQVLAAFYKVNADYYHAKLEFASYYKNALLYLACVKLTDLTEEECEARAYDLSVAALVSDSIYNFGELLLHPILDSLKDTPHAWLRELLFSFNQGDLSAYDVLTGNIDKNELLQQHKIFLYQKISLTALAEMVFRRPPHDRSMTFETISRETKVQLDEIEHLVMKALSLGLLKGSIDQVAQVARISWVQPKVLDMKQIGAMRSRLQEWDAGVNQLGHFIESVGKDVWAA